MTRSAHPPAVAIAPRPWLSRSAGECAYPVSGEGARTLACCNPCGAARYCDAHRSAVHVRPAKSAARYAADILIWLEGRE